MLVNLCIFNLLKSGPPLACDESLTGVIVASTNSKFYSLNDVTVSNSGLSFFHQMT